MWYATPRCSEPLGELWPVLFEDIRGHGEGSTVGAALSEDADGQEVSLTQRPSDTGIWGVSGGAFWRGGTSVTLEHILVLLQASSQFALRWSDQPSWFARTEGVLGMQTFWFLNQDHPRQSVVSWFL